MKPPFEELMAGLLKKGDDFEKQVDAGEVCRHLHPIKDSPCGLCEIAKVIETGVNPFEDKKS